MSTVLMQPEQASKLVEKKIAWKAYMNEYNKEYHKEYWLRNKEQIKEYRIKNKEKGKEYWKEYRIKNQDKIKQYKEQYQKKNPRSSGKKYTFSEIIAMNEARKRDHNTCQWQGCGLTHEQTEIHAHHIFPRSEYPEWSDNPQYIICYCVYHHAMFHEYRGDRVAKMLHSRISKSVVL